MSLETEIKDAFARHESDVQSRPDAWRDVESRIGRSHRRRVVVAGVGASLVIAGSIVAIPRIGSSPEPSPPIVPGPVSTAGWTTFQSKLDGFRLSRPSNWSARRDDATDVTSIVPNDVTRDAGKALFSLDLVVDPGNYRDALIYGRKAPEFQVREGKLKGGYPYVRVEHRSGGNVSVAYHIDWTTPLCTAAADCKRPTQGTVLRATISAATHAMSSRYGATAEQSVQTIQAIPRERPAAAATVVAKIPVAASHLAVGEDAIWALQQSETAGNPGKLLRIDPKANRVVASIEVGVSPTAVAADSHDVWVVNGALDGYASPFPSQNSVMRIDPRTNRIVASIQVRKPQDVAPGRSGAVLYVTAMNDSDSGITLVTIDSETNKVYGTLALPGTSEFAHITVGEGPPSDRRDVVWVTTVPASNGGPDRTLLNRIDLGATGERLRTIEIPAVVGPAPLAAGFESVWVGVPGTTGANGLARVDVATNRVVATLDLPDAAPIGIGSVTTGEGYVWTVGGRGSMWRVDPVTNTQAGDPLILGDNPPVGAGEIIYGFGSLWVPTGDGQVWRLEP